MNPKVSVAAVCAIIFATCLALVTAMNRFDEQRRNGVIENDVFRVKVVEGPTEKGTIRHIYFEKDRGGVGTERIIDDEGGPAESAVQYYFFLSESGGYSIFKDRVNEPQNRQIVEELPKNIAYYWPIGQELARKQEPQLFAKNELQ